MIKKQSRNTEFQTKYEFRLLIVRPPNICHGVYVPNAIYRDRMINNIQYAVSEAHNALRVRHPGLIGRIRELAAGQILRPVLPAAFDIGTGKITDRHANLSAEVDLIIYNRALLPAVMYSDRDGIYPIESTYYAFEIKSEASAVTLSDAIEKTRQIIALDHSHKERYQGNKSPVVSVFFAFDSDLSLKGKSEFDRYKELDVTWKDDPVIKVMCHASEIKFNGLDFIWCGLATSILQNEVCGV